MAPAQRSFVSASASSERLSRAEARELTRQRVRQAALELFIEQGFGVTTVEAIVARAGFTRGAFYSNFADKEELFLELATDKLEEHIESATRVVRHSSPDRLLTDLRSWSAQQHDPDWVVLLAELRAHALRRPVVREGLAEHDRREREAYVVAIDALFDDAGVQPPAAPETLALMVQALRLSLPVQQLIEPDVVGEGDLFDMLELVTDACVALSRSRPDPS
jgi:AcrR family transcriptional regulator